MREVKGKGYNKGQGSSFGNSKLISFFMKGGNKHGES